MTPYYHERQEPLSVLRVGLYAFAIAIFLAAVIWETVSLALGTELAALGLIAIVCMLGLSAMASWWSSTVPPPPPQFYRWAMKIDGDSVWDESLESYATGAAAVIAAKEVYGLMNQQARVHFEIRDESGKALFNWTEEPRLVAGGAS